MKSDDNSTTIELSDQDALRALAESYRDALYEFAAQVRELRAQLAALKGSSREMEIASVRRTVNYIRKISGALDDDEHIIGDRSFMMGLLLVRSILLLAEKGENE